MVFGDNKLVNWEFYCIWKWMDPCTSTESEQILRMAQVATSVVDARRDSYDQARLGNVAV